MDFFATQKITEFTYVKTNGEHETVTPRGNTAKASVIGIHYTPFGMVTITLPWHVVLEVVSQ